MSQANNNHIVIIGSGFAAYQLVRTVRRQAPEQPITVITADNGDDYTKPDLSHVFSRKQKAEDLIKQTARDFAAEFNVRLVTHTWVEAIDPVSKCITANGQRIDYHKLVLATGASTFIPDIAGDAKEQIITLNSLNEYQQAQDKLASANSVLIIGAGMIGTEIAMDMASTGREVILINRANGVVPGIIPEFISSQLLSRMVSQGTLLQTDTEVVALNHVDNVIEVTLKNSQRYKVDAVICAAGLKPNIQLADNAGLKVNKGIVVNRQLQTSVPDIFALGDCAEIEGKVLPFMQPILLSANTLTKNLLGEATTLMLPAMMNKLKTPLLPIQFGGETGRKDAVWKVEASTDGMLAQAYDGNEKLLGFVATEAMMPKAFPLLRQLPAML